MRLHGFLDGAFEERNSIKIQEMAGRVLVLRVWEMFLEGVGREQVAHFVEPLRSRFRFHRCYWWSFVQWVPYRAIYDPGSFSGKLEKQTLGIWIYRANAVTGGGQGMSAQLCQGSHNIPLEHQIENHISIPRYVQEWVKSINIWLALEVPLCTAQLRCSITNSTTWYRKHVIAGQAVFLQMQFPSA